MRTNIEIDDILIEDVMRAIGAKTKREAVDTALRRTLLLRQQEALIGMWVSAGKVISTICGRASTFPDDACR